MQRRVLFVLKHREQPYDGAGWGDAAAPGAPLSSGLFNSARFVCEMLQDAGVEAEIVHVVDNNAIHREVVAFGATDVVIEAFWVVPEKFDELARACPGVRFIVRNHSEAPFLASEGIGFDWSLKYAERPNVAISCNAPRMLEETRFLIGTKHPDWSATQVAAKAPFLQNYYPLRDELPVRPLRDKPVVDVGCFGAVRPLKNHIVQAIAAIKFAERLGKALRFHVNAGRVEMNGSPILANLRQLFAHYDRHELVEQPWAPHGEFRRVVASMDLVAQCSFSETFNIVAADAVAANVPVVTSAEIAWTSPACQADPTSSAEIADRMLHAFRIKAAVPTHNPNLPGLKAYNRQSRAGWLEHFSLG